jgi:hypothetical protein
MVAPLSNLHFHLLTAKEDVMARRSKAKKRPASKAKKRSAIKAKRVPVVARPGKLSRAFLAEVVEGMELAWGKKVSPAFKRRVIEISAELGMDPNNLMAAMAFESARTFRADIENPLSGAVGLIQFMPATAKGLGTSTSALKKMTPVAQLDFVRRYFLPQKGRLNDLNDVYMAILWPRAVGKPASHVLFVNRSRQYSQNKGLDVNFDGVVTKAEAASRVQQHLVEGMRPELRG